MESEPGTGLLRKVLQNPKYRCESELFPHSEHLNSDYSNDASLYRKVVSAWSVKELNRAESLFFFQFEKTLLCKTEV